MILQYNCKHYKENNNENIKINTLYLVVAGDFVMFSLDYPETNKKKC